MFWKQFVVQFSTHNLRINMSQNCRSFTQNIYTSLLKVLLPIVYEGKCCSCSVSVSSKKRKHCQKSQSIYALLKQQRFYYVMNLVSIHLIWLTYVTSALKWKSVIQFVILNNTFHLEEMTFPQMSNWVLSAIRYWGWNFFYFSLFYFIINSVRCSQ